MKPTPQQILQAVQEEFELLLKEKTSWGRNDLLLVFEKAKVAALLRFV